MSFSTFSEAKGSQSDSEDEHLFHSCNSSYKKSSEKSDDQQKVKTGASSSHRQGSSSEEQSLETDFNCQDFLSRFLSLKFSHINEDLKSNLLQIWDEEKISKKKLLSFLTEIPKNDRIIDNSESTVTFFLPKKIDALSNEEFKGYILASSFYPKEFDPYDKMLSEVESLIHVQKQLAYASAYGHPIAGSILNDIAENFGLSADHNLYRTLENQQYADNWDVYRISGSIAYQKEPEYISLNLLDREALEKHFTEINQIISHQ